MYLITRPKESPSSNPRDDFLDRETIVDQKTLKMSNSSVGKFGTRPWFIAPTVVMAFPHGPKTLVFEHARWDSPSRGPPWRGQDISAAEYMGKGHVWSIDA